jgi:hypothetical protein
MILKRLTTEQLLADIRQRFEQGHMQATAERMKRIAVRENDPDILRQLVDIACDALIAPPVKNPRKRPPAKKLVIRKDGVVDIDATPPMTAREQMRLLKDQARDHEIYDQVEARVGKFTVPGAFVEVARVRKVKEPEVRKAYYRVKKQHSIKV